MMRQPLPPAELDRNRHAAPQVFERLRDAIISLALAPGTVLSRAALAQQYGVSQTPVRDALMILAEEGLVDIFPQHATKVSQINLLAARQAHFLRRALEIEIVRTLAEAPDPALIQDLQALVDEQRRALEVNDLARLSALDQAFHQRQYVEAGVMELWVLQRRHSGHIDRLRHLHLPLLGKAATILDDHQRIVDAIASGRGEAAETHLRRHLSGTLARIEDLCQRFPDYVRR